MNTSSTISRLQRKLDSMAIDQLREQVVLLDQQLANANAKIDQLEDQLTDAIHQEMLLHDALTDFTDDNGSTLCLTKQGEIYPRQGRA